MAGIPKWALWGGAAFAGWWFFLRKKPESVAAPVLPAPAPAPLPGTAPPALMPGEMEVVLPTPEAIAENTTAAEGLGYTGGMFSRHLFAGQK